MTSIVEANLNSRLYKQPIIAIQPSKPVTILGHPYTQ